jgi:hypothetical protein
VNQLFLVWILDALNEMPRYGPFPHGRPLIEELVGFVKHHDHHRFVISCRIRDYQSELQPIPGLYQIELRDLNPVQIHDIIFRRLQKQDGEELWQALKGSDELIKAWRAYPKIDFWNPVLFLSLPLKLQWAHDRMISDARKLMLLCRNPYNLGVIIDLVAIGGVNSIPSNRGLLFERFTRLLLQREEMQALRQGRLWPKGTTDRIKQALQSIAVSMQKAGQQTEINKSYVMDLLEVNDAEDLLIKAEAANIIKSGDNTLKFIHQLLQEFFASGFLREAMASGQPATLFWPANCWWLSQEWEEPAIILAGYDDLATIVRWIAPANPLLAERCLYEININTTSMLSSTSEYIDLGAFALKKLEEFATKKAKIHKKTGHNILSRLARVQPH